MSVTISDSLDGRRALVTGGSAAKAALTTYSQGLANDVGPKGIRRGADHVRQLTIIGDGAEFVIDGGAVPTT